MGRQFVTACMFCLLCTTHTRCVSHHDKNDANPFGNSGQIGFHRDEGGGGDFNFDDFQPFPSEDFAISAKRKARDVSKDDVDYVKVIFEKYGNGETLSKAGFNKLLDTLGLKIESKGGHIAGSKKNSSNTTSGSKCLPLASKIPEGGLQKKDYQDLCPQILLRLTPESRSLCEDDHSTEHDHDIHHDDEVVSSSATWFYATLSVLLISLCGLLAVAVIPLMQKKIYHGLLQFLVALAVGTLVGDALLHLLPHAMMSAHSDHAHSSGHNSSDDEDLHTTNLWKGFVAALSAIFFYFTEKGLSLATDWKKRHQRKNKAMTKVRVMREDRSSHEEARVGEKLCKHKYSSYPYCYGEIADNTAENHPKASEGENANNANFKESENSKAQEREAESKEEPPNAEKQLLDSSEAQNEYTTIILREHDNVHHGHSHTHGHVHSAPGSIKSVAWMIIMGDGIHNLTDGLAIGAAFAANIGGGLSTAVAVFCHELPHEIGDFAVLLKAGMSIKEAVVYNMISSILCLIGMSMGVILGQNDHVKLWVFSAAAGMFLYIALVDMIPELTSNHSSDGGSACCQCLVQLLGLLSGVGIMLVIALYEHDLMSIFNNSL
ncbi:ZIP Zinc transporter [Nesidiocoris tenuis]|uniref:ZIP Zinc transporter n=1 Tax=Nesidiocoris tenuis TaxID=355587 RepID=A0ABN7ASG7_9HEMI|nr:ZIP Zinc transporter [Nesidiocoris tenuis]